MSNDYSNLTNTPEHLVAVCQRALHAPGWVVDPKTREQIERYMNEKKKECNAADQG